MYCSRCGKAVRDDDNFCNNCGYRLQPDSGAGIGAENVENPSYDSGDGSASSQSEARKVIDTSEFVWDVHDFERPTKKIEDIVVNWEDGRLSEVSKAQAIEEKEQPPAERTHIEENPQIAQVPTAATEEIQPMVLTANEDELAGSPEPSEPVTIEDIERELGEANSAHSTERREDTAKINQFYTFNQKNAEFQKLLDKEYERLAKSSAGTIPKGLLLEQQETAVQEISKPGIILESQLSKAQDVPAAEEVFKDKDIFENDEIIKKFGNLEFDPEKAALFDEFFLGEQTVTDTSAQEQQIIEEVEAVPQAEEETCSPEEITSQDILSYAGQSESAEAVAEASEQETAETPEEVSTPAQEHAEASPIADQAAGEEPSLEEAVAETAPILSEELIEVKTADTADEAVCEEKPDVKFAAMEQFLDGEPETEQPQISDEETKSGGKAWKIILTLIVIILLVEAALLGIRNFAPDSEAAKFIDDKMNAVVTYVMELVNKDDNQEQDEDANKPDEPTDVIAIALPTEDKTALINSQLGHNKNIESVYANEELKYSPTTKYGTEEIAKSLPISDNLLYATDSGVSVYKDQAAVAAVISFDSQWIDYVNNKDETVFNRLIADSVAYKNCKAYKKAGKITENFLALEIGEIRETAEGYFIWTREKIEIIENGVKKTGTYNWVYYLEEADGELKIVNYYKY